MEVETQAPAAVSKQDSSPPQAVTRNEPPSKEQILFIAQSAIANLQESLQRQFGPQDVDEVTKTAVAKSLNVTCDVYLASLNLTHIPEELTNVIRQGVTRITFAHNYLTNISSLSKGFPECHALKYLVLRSNELREFPAACFELPNLELLDLKKNYIEALPEDLDRMTRLRVLSVVRNKIQKLPVCIGQMKALHQFATRRNPIIFPPKEHWALDNGVEEEPKGDKAQPDKEKSRDMAETAKIKKYLQDYRAREQKQKEGDSEISESNIETPRPARRKASGRFPIKPSISGIEYNTEPIPASPLPPRPPPLPSKSYARAGNQPLNAAMRPGVAPFITSNERNRSNSESQMPTSVREKRMGIVTRKNADSERLDVRKSNRLSHLRGLSHGSALQNAMAPPVSDSSSQTSPVDGDFPRRVFSSRRLSSLPEGKRKSRFEDPHVDVARTLLYSLNQIYVPIKELIRILKLTSPRRSSVERTFYNASTFLLELGRRLQSFEERQEDRIDEDRRQSTASIYDACITCIRTFEQLAFTLKKNMRAVVAQTSPQLVRTLLLLLYSSLIEVRNSCIRLGDVDLRPTAGDEYQDFDRGRMSSSSSMRRPVTSVRPREFQDSTLNGSRSDTMRGPHQAQKLPTFSERSRAASNASLNSASLRSMDNHVTYGAAAPALSTSNTFSSLEDDESLQFDRIWHKVNSASDLAVEVLPSCMAMLLNARNVGSARASEAELNSYDLLLDRCKRVRDGVAGLKKRLSAFSLKDPALSSHPEFWSSVTIFTREYFIFAGNIKEGAKSTSSFPYEIKSLLKPLHAIVKDISRTINNSPWAHLAATHVQHQKSPYQQQFSTTQSQNQGHNALIGNQQPPRSQQPPLSLQTRGPVPPANPSDPVSAVSVVSSNGNSALSSGHVTPLPATPMSAALGPAAIATMPMIPDLPASTQPLGAGLFASINAAGNGAQTAPTNSLERSRSVSQRR